MDRKIFLYIVLLGFVTNGLFGMKSPQLELWSPNLAGSEQDRLGVVTMAIARLQEGALGEKGTLYFDEGNAQEIRLIVSGGRSLGIFRPGNSSTPSNFSAMIPDENKEEEVCITVTSDLRLGVERPLGSEPVLTEKKYYAKLTQKKLKLLDDLSARKIQLDHPAIAAIKALLNYAGGWIKSPNKEITWSGKLVFGAMLVGTFVFLLKRFKYLVVVA